MYIFLQFSARCYTTWQDSFWAFQYPVFYPASRQCTQVLVDLPWSVTSVLELVFSGKSCASFWAHLHPAFEASLPGENPKCFERNIFFQYFLPIGKICDSEREKIISVSVFGETKLLNNNSF